MSPEKRKLCKWMFMLVCLIFTAACEKVQFEPVIIPDTDLSFATDIQPILSDKCVSCHPPTKNLDLNNETSYNELVPAYAAPADSVNPEASRLYQKLTGSSHSAKTSDIEKQEILKWISQGVPNN